MDGIVFSKTDFTHALQQFSTLRDDAVEKLCQEGIFIKDDVFAKQTSAGITEYLDGYIKCGLALNDGTTDDIEDSVNFGDKLSTYEITLEEYINSFNNKQPFIQNSDNNFIKRVLNRSDIKLTSFLFSVKFVDFISKNNFYSQRFYSS